MKNIYFYRVETYITSFEKDKPSFDYTEAFSGVDLLSSKRQAINYYNQQVDILKNKDTFFGKPFGTPDNFHPDNNSAFSVVLYFVQVENGEETVDFPIAGDSEHEMEEGRELEREVFKSLGMILIEV